MKGKGTPIIFDRQVWSPPTGGTGEYDCAGVFECFDEDVRVGPSISGVELMKMEKPIPSLAVLVSGNHPSLVWYCGVTDEWMLPAQSILDGEFTDKRSGKTAKLEKVWPRS